MSERGTYCTQYIHCNRCAAAVAKSMVGEPWEGAVASVANGRAFMAHIRASHPGGEIEQVEDVAGQISKLVCHPVRLMVLTDSGVSAVVTALANGQGFETVRGA